MAVGQKEKDNTLVDLPGRLFATWWTRAPGIDTCPHTPPHHSEGTQPQQIRLTSSPFEKSDSVVLRFLSSCAGIMTMYTKDYSAFEGAYLPGVLPFYGRLHLQVRMSRLITNC